MTKQILGERTNWETHSWRFRISQDSAETLGGLGSRGPCGTWLDDIRWPQIFWLKKKYPRHASLSGVLQRKRSHGPHHRAATTGWGMSVSVVFPRESGHTSSGSRPFCANITEISAACLVRKVVVYYTSTTSNTHRTAVSSFLSFCLQFFLISAWRTHKPHTHICLAKSAEDPSKLERM